MKTNFSFRKFGNEAQDTLVESFAALCNSQIAGKGNTAEYQEANRQFNEAFMAECMSAMPNVASYSLEDIKNPMVHKNMFFLERFNTILAQMLTPVIPAVVSAGYENLYDVTQVGFGVA